MEKFVVSKPLNSDLKVYDLKDKKTVWLRDILPKVGSVIELGDLEMFKNKKSGLSIQGFRYNYSQGGRYIPNGLQHGGSTVPPAQLSLYIIMPDCVELVDDSGAVIPDVLKDVVEYNKEVIKEATKTKEVKKETTSKTATGGIILGLAALGFMYYQSQNNKSKPKRK